MNITVNRSMNISVNNGLRSGMKSDNTHEEFHKQFVRTGRQTRVMAREDFTYINFFRYILPVIEKTGPRKILDIGSGAGTVSLFLARMGYEVEGIEVSGHAVEASVESAQALGLTGRVTFSRADFLEFSTEDNFDTVLCLEVIEHCNDDGLFLEKAHNMLRAGGLMVLSTPLATAPLSRLGLTDGFDRSVGHLRRYTKEQIVKKVSSAGFIVDQVVLTEGFVRNSLFVFPVMSFLKRLIKGSVLAQTVTYMDDLSGRLFGYSDVIVTARKG